MTTRKSSPKPKNQLGLLAGMDKDIESAKHDDIMLWTDKNLPAILKKIMPKIFGDEWVTHYDKILDPNFCGHFGGGTVFIYPRIIPYDLFVPRPPFEITKKEWERPIRDRKSGGLVGFTDLHVEATYYTMDGRVDEQKEKYGATAHEVEIYFEIKTTIQLGQMIRQINLYKMHTIGSTTPDKFVVVSPDTRYVDTLKEQDILFVEYMDPTV